MQSNLFLVAFLVFKGVKNLCFKYQSHIKWLFIMNLFILLITTTLSFFIESAFFNVIFILSFLIEFILVIGVVFIFVLYWIGRIYQSISIYRIRHKKGRDIIE